MTNNNNIKLSWYALKVPKAQLTKFQISKKIQTLAESDFLYPYIKECVMFEKKKVTYNKKNEAKETIINAFPPYIFINMYLEDNSIRRQVIEFICHALGVPRLNIIGGYSDPRKISDTEFLAMSNALQEAEEKNDAVNMSEGSNILIQDGPFKSMNGIIIHIDHEKKQVIAEVKIFGKGTEIELRFDQFTIANS